MWGMTESELSEIISKYQLPMDDYLVEVGGAFGRGEFFWIIKNQSKLECYREGGFDNLEAIPRRIETIELASDAEDEISKYLFGMYSIFEIKS